MIPNTNQRCFARGSGAACITSHFLKPQLAPHFTISKDRTMPYLYQSFSAKEPYNQWLICGKRPPT